MNYAAESKEATGFIGNISNLHRDSLSTLQLITNINNIYKNFIKLDHLQDNDIVELKHSQHRGGVVNSTVGHHPDSLAS